MNYEIQIHDMQNESDPLIVHFASSDSISLQYEGGEELDKVIDGSSVQFDLETLFGEDFKYGQYFTSDEKRYRVTWVIEDTQEIIWRGFILPETFAEPYDHPLFYTQFEAVCGLGLLKGKQLSEDFYKEEKTVIQVISACLRLTKVDFDIYMAPALHNRVQENWNTIYTDMLRFDDEEKRPSAYEILDDLLYSMLCKVYQCEGRWYIEGFNRRNLPKNKFFKYDIYGKFLGTQVLEKNIKELTYFIDGPATVSMVPALGRLTVSHESPKVEFPKAVYKDDDLDLTAPTGLYSFIFPREWIIYGQWDNEGDNITRYPKHLEPEYYLRLPWNRFDPFQPQNKIELRKKIYLLKNTPVQLVFKVQFRNGTYENLGDAGTTNFDRGNFENALLYRIKLDDKVLFSTLPGQEVEPHPMNLDAQGKGELKIDFQTEANGYLSLEIFQAYGEIYAFVAPTLYFNEISIRNLRNISNEVVSLVVDENSSVTKDIDLPFSDDISANSPCFTLEPIRDLDMSQLRIFKVPILYGYTLNGNNYAIVDMYGAVLMEQYPEEVNHNLIMDPVDNFEVIYNLNGTSEMAIKTEILYTDGVFNVYVRPLAEPTTDRLDWLKWTDSVYGVEEKKYGEVVAEIYRRLFQVPRLKLSGTAEAPYKYNDLLVWNFNGEKRYFAFSNLEYRPSGTTVASTFTAYEAFYEGVGVGNVPPYVYAGPDLTLDPFDYFVQVSEAVVNDPDGGTPTILWEQISGDPGAIISNPAALNPGISNLNYDDYEFRITATDEAGNTASDTMRVVRPETYELIVVNTANWGTSWPHSDYSISFDPVLEAGTALLIHFRIQVNIEVRKGSVFAFETWLMKNGNKVFVTGHLGELTNNHNFTETGSLQMEAGSDLKAHHNISISNNFKGTVTMKITFTGFEFLYGQSAVIETPYPEVIKVIEK